MSASSAVATPRLGDESAAGVKARARSTSAATNKYVSNLVNRCASFHSNYKEYELDNTADGQCSQIQE